MLQQQRRGLAEKPATSIEHDAAEKLLGGAAFDTRFVAFIARPLAIQAGANAGREFRRNALMAHFARPERLPSGSQTAEIPAWSSDRASL